MKIHWAVESLFYLCYWLVYTNPNWSRDDSVCKEKFKESPIDWATNAFIAIYAYSPELLWSEKDRTIDCQITLAYLSPLSWHPTLEPSHLLERLPFLPSFQNSASFFLWTPMLSGWLFLFPRSGEWADKSFFAAHVFPLPTLGAISSQGFPTVGEVLHQCHIQARREMCQ